MRITDINLKHYYAKYYLVKITDGEIYLKYFETASDLKVYCTDIFKEDFKTVKSIYEFVQFVNPLGDFELFTADKALELIDFILNCHAVTDAVKLKALKELF